MAIALSPQPRRRLAAGLAIGCLAGALLTALLLLAGDAWRVVLSLVLTALAVASLWFAVARHGGQRVGAAVAALACLGAIVAVVVTGQFHGLGLGITFALILASGALARVALARDQPQRGWTGTAPAVVQQSHPVLLMNPKSGGGKVERFRLVDECRDRRIEPIVLERGDDLTQLAEDAISRGADAIGMAGGDGSQALVAAVASKHGLPYVCVPAGTRNHFALDLGLDRSQVVMALDAFVDGIDRRIDLARVNGRVFVNNACLGLYAKIVQSQAYRDAKLRTAADMLPDLLGPDARPLDLRFVGPEGEEHSSAHLILVSNNPYLLDSLAGRGSRARLDTGRLGVMAVEIDGSRQAVEFIALEAAGRVRSFNQWLEWETPRFVVDSAGPIEIGVDGEALALEPPLTFEISPAALTVRLPKSARGVSPAAAAVNLSWSVVGDLFRVAAGRPPSAE